MNSQNNIEISDRVKVGERTGKVVSIENIDSEKRKYEILFEEEGQLRSYISPPTEITKIQSPVERARKVEKIPKTGR